MEGTKPKTQLCPHIQKFGEGQVQGKMPGIAATPELCGLVFLLKTKENSSFCSGGGGVGVEVLLVCVCGGGGGGE